MIVDVEGLGFVDLMWVSVFDLITVLFTYISDLFYCDFA